MAAALGIGGVFFRAEDPEALTGWYARWLGIELDSSSGASFRCASMPDGAFTVWGAFKHDTDYFGPGAQTYMINFIVDDLYGALRQVRDGGATVIDTIEEPRGQSKGSE